MKALAPGKVVLSGAYAVLDGAPAIVTAVNRYVHADAARAATFLTPEVSAALHAISGPASAPHFDASELRQGDRKLGLGSSAAILVASLGALGVSDVSEGNTLLSLALAAHNEAQSGGSGIDVVASTLGGTLTVQRSPAHSLGDGGTRVNDVAGTHQLSYRRISLPNSLVFEVWAADSPASTSDFLRRTRALRAVEPAAYERLLGPLREASDAALAACDRNDASALAAALGAQRDGFLALGEKIGAPIVTDAMRALDERARGQGSLLLPAGAGGGDICTYVGAEPSNSEFRQFAATLNHVKLDLELGARGLHRPEP